MESVRAEETASLLRSIAASASAGATINLSQKVAALSNDIVTRAVFGGKFSQQRDFLHAIDQLSDLLGGCWLYIFWGPWAKLKKGPLFYGDWHGT
jgi:hypothetical protein